MRTHFDVIVLGGGTMGTAAAWALGRRGISCLVFEQFQHVHAMGSHGGETRIIRHAYAESPEYVPLVQRADRLWQELEAETGENVLVRCGGLEAAAPGYGHARAARVSAEEHGLPYEWLSPRDVEGRWPQFRIPDGWEALHSPQSGFLLTEPALRGMANLARAAGATILENTPVKTWGTSPDGAWVETASGRFAAQSLIITAGAWTVEVASSLGLLIEIRRKTLWWQAVDDVERYQPDRMPVFITDSPAGEIYGFPIFGTPGLKIANHAGGEPVTASTVDRTAYPGENRDILELAHLVLPGVRPEVVQSAVCLYAVTPDHDFIVDRHPEFPRVVFGAGFSGHGFKFAPAIGELLAELAIDERRQPLPKLSPGRFQKLGNPALTTA